MNRIGLAANAFFVCLTLLCAASAFAQGGSMSPYQDEKDGVSAGGKWMKFQSDDKMTGAKKVRFELLADNFFKEDPDYKPRVDLYCEAESSSWPTSIPACACLLPIAPASGASRKWKSRSASTTVTPIKGWNWVRGHFLSMDKGTTRGLLGAQVFNVALPTRNGREIAEFSPQA